MLQSTPQATPDLQDYLKTEVNRLRTFSRRPPHLKQTPELLSEAGFYHLPTEERPDRVKCAYCQGKLSNWQEEDDPWIEHSRCFPNCPYVELCMGKGVVRELLENSTAQVPVENEGISKDTQTSAEIYSGVPIQTSAPSHKLFIPEGGELELSLREYDGLSTSCNVRVCCAKCAK